jgi:hypothetical protein
MPGIIAAALDNDNKHGPCLVGSAAIMLGEDPSEQA